MVDGWGLRRAHRAASRGVGGWRGDCVGVAPRGQGRAPGVTPLARPCHGCRPPVAQRLRRGGRRHCGGCATDMQGPAGSGSERGRRVRGRERRAGWLRGPRASRAGLLLHARWVKAGTVGLAGWRGGAGWAMKPSGPGPQRGFLLSFPFSVFLFFSFI